MTDKRVRKVNREERKAKGLTSQRCKGKISDLCNILQIHHDNLKEDPERLTTEFILKNSKL